MMQQALSEGAQLDQQPQQDLHALNKALADLGKHRISLETLEIDEIHVIGTGGFGVVKQGKLSGYPSAVAIKRLRSDDTKDIRVAKRLVREMKAWSKLQHPNILPLLGFYLSNNLDLALIVCPLQPYGNIKDYLQQVKPSNLDRLGLVLDTIRAVEYLHNLDPPVVHGDIKALNILMSSERRAILCDFDLALASDEVQSGLTTSKGLKGSLRYCCKELLMADEAMRTRSSDMWAWGCLLVEIMKEIVPYTQLHSDGQVVAALIQEQLPVSEDQLKDPINIWSVVCGCWQANPRIRLTASMAAREIELLMATLSTNLHSITSLKRLKVEGFYIYRGASMATPGDEGFMEFSLVYDTSSSTIHAIGRDYSGAFKISGVFDEKDIRFVKTYASWEWTYIGTATQHNENVYKISGAWGRNHVQQGLFAVIALDVGAGGGGTDLSAGRIEGEWKGVYKADADPKDMPTSLYLSTKSGRKVQGAGKDSPGEFKFSGSYNNETIDLMKTYTMKDLTWVYSGTIDLGGTHLDGTWGNGSQSLGTFRLTKSRSIAYTHARRIMPKKDKLWGEASESLRGLLNQQDLKSAPSLGEGFSELLSI
ncbi:hypothetical protein FRB94_005635 [Tulasnella sp. JGI-2019a]|nr:hypothetical protein FRB94_005635 [Tulasnella sp. JGI-2019a]